MSEHNYIKIITELKCLSQVQKQCLYELGLDSYIDGWVNGNCHTSNLTPDQHQTLIDHDWDDSWSKMVIGDVND